MNGGARRRRRAPAILPDHEVRRGRRSRGSAPPAGARAAGPGERLRPAGRVMRSYRTLLQLYPASFREEYGDEMRAIFARRWRQAPRAADRAMLVIEALIDVFRNAPAAHRDVLTQDLRTALHAIRRAPGLSIKVVVITPSDRRDDLCIQSLLAGISPIDIATFAAAGLLVILVAVIGTLLPALRAMRVNPTEVLGAG